MDTYGPTDAQEQQDMPGVAIHSNCASCGAMKRVGNKDLDDKPYTTGSSDAKRIRLRQLPLDRLSSGSFTEKLGAWLEIFTDYVVKDTEQQKRELRDDLITFYLERYSTLPLNPLMTEMDVELQKLYIRPRLVFIERCNQFRPWGNTETETKEKINRDIFADHTARNIYIIGNPGSGKSSLCRDIAMQWCDVQKGNRSNDTSHVAEASNVLDFDYLFLVDLRKASHQTWDIDTMIQEQIVEELSRSEEFNAMFVNRLLSTEKCLIILDGLDGWTHPSKGICRRTESGIPHRKARKNCTILTTSRPWIFSDVRLKDSEVDEMLEISSPDDSRTMVENVLKCLYDKFKKPKSLAECMAWVGTNGLNKLLPIPIVLTQLVCLWYEGCQFAKSRCRIYSHIVDVMLRLANSSVERMRTGSEPLPQLPSVLDSSPECQKDPELIMSLSILAYCTFRANEFEANVVDTYVSADTVARALRSGVLSRTTSHGVLRSETKYSFLEKSFHEFFAALHISTTCKIPEKIHILDEPDMFIFVCGMNPEAASLMSESILKDLAENQRDVRLDFTWLQRITETFECGLREGQNNVQDASKLQCLVQAIEQIHGIIKDRAHSPVTNEDDCTFHVAKYSVKSLPVHTFTCRHLKDIDSRYYNFLDELELHEEKRTDVLAKKVFSAVDSDSEITVAFTTKILQTDNFKGHRCQEEHSLKKGSLHLAYEMTNFTRYPSSLDFLVILASSDEEQHLVTTHRTFFETKPNIIVILVGDDANKPKAETIEFLADIFVLRISEYLSFDRVMERCAFELLKPKVTALTHLMEERHEDPSVKCLKGTNRLTREIRELLSETKAAYVRSKVPTSEWPIFQETDVINESTIDQVLLFDNVIGCSVRFDTLYVSIDVKIPIEEKQVTKDKVIKFLRENGVSNYAIKYASEKLDFHTSVGAQVGAKGKGPAGTLGAFAYMDLTKAVDQNKTLCGLISQHVATALLRVRTRDLHENGKIIGDILKANADCKFDIAAAKIHESVVNDCDLTFKDEDGEEKSCKLFDYKNCHLKEYFNGLNAHLWGAVTKPGKGKIIDVKYKKKEIGPFILLESRFDGNHFSTPGDSGAIVCFIEPEGQCIQALGMLMGTFTEQCEDSDESSISGKVDAMVKPTEDLNAACGIIGEEKQSDENIVYIALPLQLGLEDLSNVHDKTFTLCVEREGIQNLSNKSETDKKA